MEGLREDCGFCKDPLRGRTPIKSGYVMYNGERIEWVLLPSLPGMSSVTLGQHLIFTTTSHHVGSEEHEVRDWLMKLARHLGLEILGSFRLILNQGNMASSFEHFHVHLIAPGEGELLVSAVANIPAVLDEFVAAGVIRAPAAGALEDRILQKAR